MKKNIRLLVAGAIGVLISSVAWGQGGVVLLGGDDLNDHGSRSDATVTGVNQTGWKYIENGLRSMAPQVRRAGPFTVDVLALTVTPATSLATSGCDGAAILSAATNAGLTVQYVDGAAAVTTFFASLAAGTVNPKILWIPGDGNCGGTDSAEEAALAANSAALNAYVGSGGGLFAHTGRYTWLTAVLPGSSRGSSCSSSTLSLTAVGQSVFPALTNTDIRSGPCHNNFLGNLGGLQVLAADGGGNAIIIGGLTGSGGLTDLGGGAVHPVTCFSGPVVTDVAVTGAITSTLPAPVIFTITSGNLGFGLQMHANGNITGTPGIAGTFPYTIIATDATATLTRTHCTLVVGRPQPVPTITTACPLNSATAGAAFSQTLSTSGGVGALTYSISAGALPAGLTLTSGGSISGAATAAGSSTFTLQVIDTGVPRQTATKSCSMTVDAIPAAPVITTACPLSNGAQAIRYFAALTATGAAPVTWSITGGALPAGLALSATGSVSGVPAAVGVANFTLTATNAGGPVSQACSLSIFPAFHQPVASPAINNSCPLSSATVGTAYSTAFSSTGGLPSLTYSISVGALPTGLALSSGGVVSGTPTAAGTATFTVLVTDSSTPAALTGSKACSLAVVAAPPPPPTPTAPSFTTACPLPGGTAGVNYTQTVTATGGTAPYTFSITTGALPNPLRLSAGGVIAGNPHHPGLYAFTLQVAGANGLSSQLSCSLTVAAAGGVLQSRGGIRYMDENADGIVPVEFELSETLPYSVTGRAYLVARSKIGRDSDDIRFVTGGREADFVIEAGQTKAKFTTDDFGIRVGDRSAELVLSIVLEANGTRISVDLSGTEAVRTRADQ